MIDGGTKEEEDRHRQEVSIVFNPSGYDGFVAGANHFYDTEEAKKKEEEATVIGEREDLATIVQWCVIAVISAALRKWYNSRSLSCTEYLLQSFSVASEFSNCIVAVDSFPSSIGFGYIDKLLSLCSLLLFSVAHGFSRRTDHDVRCLVDVADVLRSRNRSGGGRSDYHHR